MIRCINKHSLLMTVLIFSTAYMQGAENNLVEATFNPAQDKDDYLVTVYLDNHKKNYAFKKNDIQYSFNQEVTNNHITIYYQAIFDFIKNNYEKEESTYMKRFKEDIFSISTIKELNKILASCKNTEEYCIETEEINAMCSFTNVCMLFRFLQYHNLINPNVQNFYNAMQSMHEAYFNSHLVPLLKGKDSNNNLVLFLSDYLPKIDIITKEKFSFLIKNTQIKELFLPEKIDLFLKKFEYSDEQKHINKNIFTYQTLESLQKFILTCKEDGYFLHNIITNHYNIPNKKIIINTYFLMFYLDFYKLLSEDYRDIFGQLHQYADIIISSQD